MIDHKPTAIFQKSNVFKKRFARKTFLKGVLRPKIQHCIQVQRVCLKHVTDSFILVNFLTHPPRFAHINTFY